MEANLTKSLFILFLPLISFIYQIFFGKYLGRNTHYVSIALIGAVLYLSVSFLLQSISKGYGTILEVSEVWFSSTDFSVHLGIFVGQYSINNALRSCFYIFSCAYLFNRVYER